MSKLFYYSWKSPIRLLLPISALFFIIPPLFPAQLMNYLAFPTCYLFGSYFVFLNFPGIAGSLQAKMLYIDDLVITKGVKDETFKQIYNVLMDFVLAVIFAIASESVVIQGIDERPLVEIIALIGGTYSFCTKTQDIAGKYLLRLCHLIKEIEIERRDSVNSRHANEIGMIPLDSDGTVLS